MKEVVNTKIKFREPYRPFAPVVLAERAGDYFELSNLEHRDLTNFMLGVFPVKKNKRKIIPAVTHVDGSGRLQIISSKQNARYYKLVKKFGQKTGVYVLMNTSFNLKGEPIVNSPENAFNTFKKSGLDILALEFLKGLFSRGGEASELLKFLWEARLWFLIPFVLVLLIFGILMVFAQSTGVAPFIYTLF